jgi:uncharacterized membrane protein YhaH (DUF805 family)
MSDSIYWFVAALKNYTNFHGRARRKEYWYFILINLLVLLALTAIEYSYKIKTFDVGFGNSMGLLSSLYLLFIFLPTVAVTTRRLHDTNRSGWWQLLYLVPAIGVLVIFICTLEDSFPGSNQYGKNPRGNCMILHY